MPVVRASIGAFCLALSASAAAVAADPKMFLETSAINGLGTTIQATRVPVRDANGKITYKDITVPFTVGPAGNVSLNTAGVSILASPTLITGAFRSGTYKGFAGHLFSVATLGAGGGGRVTTSIRGLTREFNATWVSGPVTGHPYETLLDAAGLTSPAQTYGVMGQVHIEYDWSSGSILGAVQTGNQLTLINYVNDTIPNSTMTFTLCANPDVC